MDPQITVLSPLDWPTKLPTTTILSGCGASFLEYTAYKTKQIPFNYFSSHRQIENDSNSTLNKPVRPAKRGNDKKASAIDLTTLTPEELEDLSYYDILGGIAMHSTPEQIRRSFHKASLKYHPDKQKDADSKTTSNAKKQGAGEDPVFLKVKEAFETLSDAAKRKAYDSTVDFDESIPSASDIQSENDFYTIFGSCFERNLRFAAENDPDRFKGDNSGSGGGGKKGKRKNQGKKGGKTESSSSSTQTLLGDNQTPIEEVNRFYDYWVRFESWRDFTLAATKLTEHDTDMADSRYEKRWMEKEIARKAKAMKRDEMARISKLVERSLALDPRIKREKEREAREKKERARLKREQQEREEQERKNKEEKERKEQQERELKEKEERARIKAKRDEEKKVLRVARQSFRKLVLSTGGESNVWKNMEDMNDDVELLCSKLGAVELDALTSQVTSSSNSNGDASFAVVFDKAMSLKDDQESKRQEGISKRDAMRKEAAKKESAAKAARATKPWTKEELSALAKAVKKYPAGGANRWDAISLFVNNLCKPVDPRTKDECIEKYNQVANASKSGVGNTTSNSISTPNSEAKKADQTSTASSNTWTDEQDQQLQEGLAKYPSTMDKNERWSNIAKGVKNKSKKECVQRFKAIRVALKNKK